MIGEEGGSPGRFPAWMKEFREAHHVVVTSVDPAAPLTPSMPSSRAGAAGVRSTLAGFITFALFSSLEASHQIQPTLKGRSFLRGTDAQEEHGEYVGCCLRRALVKW